MNTTRTFTARHPVLSYFLLAFAISWGGILCLAWGLIGGGFLEELGWTGFAVPRLRQHHGVLTTP